NGMITPAIPGVLNMLNVCVKAKVKRVQLTSSIASVLSHTLKGIGLVMNEDNGSNVEFLYTKKPPTW
ncbi:hypothetical protein Droror1_Dr00016594, partial [Drosera rotundifolia]